MSFTVQVTMTNLMIKFTKTPSSSYKKTLFETVRLLALWITHYSTRQVSKMVTVTRVAQVDFDQQPCAAQKVVGTSLKNNS